MLGRNADRAAKAWVKYYHSEAYLFYIKRHACIVTGCRRQADAAHAVSKGAGGTWRDLFPCCHEHHMEQHNGGMQTFMDKYGVDPFALAHGLSGAWVDPVVCDREI